VVRGAARTQGETKIQREEALKSERSSCCVTGGGGFIGVHLVAALRQQDQDSGERTPPVARRLRSVHGIRRSRRKAEAARTAETFWFARSVERDELVAWAWFSAASGSRLRIDAIEISRVVPDTYRRIIERIRVFVGARTTVELGSERAGRPGWGTRRRGRGLDRRHCPMTAVFVSNESRPRPGVGTIVFRVGMPVDIAIAVGTNVSWRSLDAAAPSFVMSLWSRRMQVVVWSGFLAASVAEAGRVFFGAGAAIGVADTPSSSCRNQGSVLASKPPPPPPPYLSRRAPGTERPSPGCRTGLGRAPSVPKRSRARRTTGSPRRYRAERAHGDKRTATRRVAQREGRAQPAILRRGRISGSPRGDVAASSLTAPFFVVAPALRPQPKARVPLGKVVAKSSPMNGLLRARTFSPAVHAPRRDQAQLVSHAQSPVATVGAVRARVTGRQVTAESAATSDAELSDGQEHGLRLSCRSRARCEAASRRSNLRRCLAWSAPSASRAEPRCDRRHRVEGVVHR